MSAIPCIWLKESTSVDLGGNSLKTLRPVLLIPRMVSIPLEPKDVSSILSVEMASSILDVFKSRNSCWTVLVFLLSAIIVLGVKSSNPSVNRY